MASNQNSESVKRSKSNSSTSLEDAGSFDELSTSSVLAKLSNATHEENIRLKDVITGLEKKISGYISDNKELISTCKTLQQKVDWYKADLDTAKENLKNANVELKKVKDNNTLLKSQHVCMQTRLGEAEKKREELASTLKDYRQKAIARVKELDNQVKLLKNSNELAKKADALDAEVKQLRLTNTDLQSRLNQELDNVHESQQSHAEELEKNNVLQTKIEQLGESLVEAQSTNMAILRLTKENEDLKQKLQRLRDASSDQSDSSSNSDSD
jgi:uncharacterized coiled-coil DUF342 family protein